MVIASSLVSKAAQDFCTSLETTLLEKTCPLLTSNI